MRASGVPSDRRSRERCRLYNGHPSALAQSPFVDVEDRRWVELKRERGDPIVQLIDAGHVNTAEARAPCSSTPSTK
jgi:hypothetical protein